MDFTKQKGLPSDWTVSDYANFRFGAHGAEFTFSKRKDSAQIWTNFYIFFGKIDVVLQVSPGIAMISNVVLMSDDHDEIDWEVRCAQCDFTILFTLTPAISGQVTTSETPTPKAKSRPTTLERG